MSLFIKSFDTLYCKTGNGKIKIWNISIFEKNEIYSYIITYGYENGKQCMITKEFLNGKNIGKKNETTSYTQCLSESLKKWKNKQEKEGYSVNISIENHSHIFLPMLAKTFQINKIQYPIYVQPKLDGIRCILYYKDNKIHYQSRTGMVFHNILSHLDSDVQQIFNHFPDIILDGELYTFDLSFEELSGLMRKKTCDEKNVNIHYHIFDIIDTKKSFEQRILFLQNQIFEKMSFIYLQLVNTKLIENENNFKISFDTYLENGYEGMMIRDRQGIYQNNKRSSFLQKYKLFQDDEFEIVDFTQGESKEKGCVIWICKTKDDIPFHVRPRGSIEYRQDLFKNGSQYIGKMLTVIYQELNPSGVPRFGVGKSIREIL
jgi:DNA ligase-1